MAPTVKWEREGILFAVWEINKAGGINGHPVEVIIYDNESKTDVGLMNYKKAIEVDKVVGICSSDTPTILAGKETFERREIPMFGITPSSALLFPARKWQFGGCASVVSPGTAIAEFFKNKGWTRIGILSCASSVVEDFVNAYKEKASRLGLTVVAHEKFGLGDTDTSVQLTKIMAANPDALYIDGYAGDTATAYKNAVTLGVKIPKVLAGTGFGDEWLAIMGAVAEGAYGALEADGLGFNLPPDMPQYNYCMKFFKDFMAWSQQTKVPHTTIGNMYDAAQIIFAAMKRVGEEPDLAKFRVKLRDEIELTRNFMTTDGPCTMSPTDHSGKSVKTYIMLKVVNGKMAVAK